MNFKIFFLGILLSTIVFAGCATTSNSNKLSEFRNTNWSKMGRLNVEQLVGKPDTTGVIHNTRKEALVYLADDRKSPQLIVVYDKQTDKIHSVHWFANTPSDKLTLEQARSRFPNIRFQENPTVKDGAWGESIAVYSAKDSPLEINMDSKTQKLSSLSWQYEADDVAERRKPTSH
ncbi:hypothetical protein D3C87_102770 [compost metagenome]